MTRFHFVAGTMKKAVLASKIMIKKYGQVSPQEAEVVVVLGGDGTMLRVLRDFMNTGKLIYGMNCGTVGFLMNEYHVNDLSKKVFSARREEIHPLRMIAKSDVTGHVEALAINEISLFRQSYQAAKIKISVDGMVRMKELICDGVMVATPAGSTAYNLSAQGAILPLMAPLMALTPVSPFRPRRWNGALLPNNGTVCFDLLERKKRPVNVAADNVEVKSVSSIIVSSAKDVKVCILFDSGHSWDERILSEQFRH